jgi:ABC-type transport system involved in multi-copper enzyme maturation permease subunit
VSARATIAPTDSGPLGTRQPGFIRTVRAEWTKLRTVRGWVVGIVLGGLLIVGVGLLNHSECGSQVGATTVTGGPACSITPGPGGSSVTDIFYFVHRPLTGNGSITVRVTSLTGASGDPGQSSQGPAVSYQLQPWSKAGIIVTSSTRQGSAYAAMMVTGSHGVRMQWNYVNDTPGIPGAVTTASPRWLRLVRSAETITGYDSTDGVHWSQVATAQLSGLPSTVQAGMFSTSPSYSVVTSQSIGGGSGTDGPSLATATFDDVVLRSGAATGTWTGTDVGSSNASYAAVGGRFRASGGRFIVTGSGDIAPAVAGDNGGMSMAQLLTGTFAGLIAVIVVGAAFMTAEYRRGLIRVTLAASPSRGRLLAAKAVAIGSAAFAAGLPCAYAAILIGERWVHSNGVSVDPVGPLTLLRLVAGTAGLLAVASVLALAIGAVMRRGAAAVATGIVVIFVPYLLAIYPGLLPAGIDDWLTMVTPAAALAIQQPYPAYPQVTVSYSTGSGYYPLPPLAGFAVLCAWAAVALGLAAYLLRRRDA